MRLDTLLPALIWQSALLQRLQGDKSMKYIVDGTEPIYVCLVAHQSVAAHSLDRQQYKEFLKQAGHLDGLLWMPI